MRKILVILSIVILNFGCSTDDSDDMERTNCLFMDPTQDLVWLEEKIKDIEANTDTSLLKYEYINQSTYQGNTVFVFYNCCPVCNSVFPVYDCTGKLLGIVGTQENDIRPDLLENNKIIWSPETFECVFTTD